MSGARHNRLPDIIVGLRGTPVVRLKESLVTDDEVRQSAILANLPEAEFNKIRPRLDVVDVETRHRVYRPREPITHVYFPLTSVYSMVAVADDRMVVEVGTIGFEGMAGLPLFLGSTTSPHATFCQVPGRSARMSAADLAESLAGDGALHGRLHHFTQTTMVELAQSVVCNNTHSAQQRAARWLLTTSDRTRNDQFPLTQEFLGQMLGVRRPTVFQTASQLQADGLIRYTRGIITIVDRSALEQAACECYAIIKTEFEALISPCNAD